MVAEVLERDGAALEDVLRRLCHEGAWGSDYGSALRWLAAIKPAGDASSAAKANFGRLGDVFVDVAAMACSAGHALKRHLRDNGDVLREANEVLSEAAAQRLVASCGDSAVVTLRSAEKGSPAAPPQKLVVADGTASCVELPPGAEVIFVDSADAWSIAEARLRTAKEVAVDTEWWDEGNGPALVQLAIGTGIGDAVCFLLDTLKAPELFGPGLRRVLSRSGVSILGWSFAQDRKRLQELCWDGVFAVDGEGVCEGLACSAVSATALPVIDLQPPCCHLLGSTTQVSLAAACKHLLGQALDKAQQCSDWRTRPLSSSQAQYAALDAAILLELSAELRRKGVALTAVNASS
eukprot:TRINITY_DN49174_c0_g1_i1.p1 TRINITY_DN49174_c0_g1~~TRINITY_DN49174_c0_g1_i1.p1  ORF type:complete len:404 (-),score=83.14 TRINITY_DN49174_c0_g1_i1:22-1071(-)